MLKVCAYTGRVKKKLTEMYYLTTKQQLTLKTRVKHTMKQDFFPAEQKKRGGGKKMSTFVKTETTPLRNYQFLSFFFP